MMQSFDGPRLHISLDKLVENYCLLASRFSGAECAAVVKANAYGLGVEAVAPALAQAGCQTFFVATLEEGIQLRQQLPDRRIAVFHGVGEGESLAYVNHQLIPVLNSPQHIARWQEVAREHRDARSILHVDTGMTRLGLTQTEWQALAAEPSRVVDCQISMIMSHLACASEPEHPANDQQAERFNEARALFPDLPGSLANSSGIFLGAKWHADLARPGCSLYGISPNTALSNPMKNVVELSAPIIQLRTLDRDQSIGYGWTCERKKGDKLATVALGYADGIFRHLSNRLQAYVGPYKVPLVGRVSMDMMIFDVSDVPDGQLQQAGRVVVMDDRQTVDDLAQLAETIGYEIFTRLGRRIRRTYSGASA